MTRFIDSSTSNHKVSGFPSVSDRGASLCLSSDTPPPPPPCAEGFFNPVTITERHAHWVGPAVFNPSRCEIAKQRFFDIEERRSGRSDSTLRPADEVEFHTGSRVLTGYVVIVVVLTGKSEVPFHFDHFLYFQLQAPFFVTQCYQLVLLQDTVWLTSWIMETREWCYFQITFLGLQWSESIAGGKVQTKLTSFVTWCVCLSSGLWFWQQRQINGNL